MFAVVLFCRIPPFTDSQMRSECGSGISSAVARNGPMGANVSALFPFTHCPPRARRFALRPRAQPLQSAAAEEALVVIFAERRCVDQTAAGELQPRPLASGFAEPNQLHETSTPPSIGYAWPVTNEASSEHKYSARYATSSRVAMPPIGR